jgi:hypothetical protein
MILKRNANVFAITSALLLCGSVPALAIVTPALSLSDGTNSVTIDGAGTITKNGAVTTTGVSIAPAGTVTWSGTIGSFVVTTVGGASKPAVPNQPAIDVGIASLVNMGSTSGILTVSWTDTGFTGISPTTLSEVSTSYFPGSGTTDYKLYLDNANQPFGKQVLSASLLGQQSGSGITASGTGVTANPFSMTLVEAITLSGGGGYSNDIGGAATAGSIVTPPSPVVHGDAATIGFWHNKNGQAVINSLNGGGSSTALTNWLASQFPALYGNLIGGNNATVAALFMTYFNVKGEKTNAQILAGALAAYATSTTLSGSNSLVAGFGFNQSPGGTGAKSYNVGANGAAVGLLNNQSYTVLQLLQQVNADSPLSAAADNAFNSIFDGINTTGDIQ